MPTDNFKTKPYLIVGADTLVAHLYRAPGGLETWQYCFHLFRSSIDGDVCRTLRPDDLPSLVKLVQVLAFSIADDGWLTKPCREELMLLAKQLDRITCNWSDTTNG